MASSWGTTAHDKVHMRAPHGHQGIMHLGPHHREAECFMGPHGYRLTCLGASLSVPAPHSLRTANFGPTLAMFYQSAGGSTSESQDPSAAHCTEHWVSSVVSSVTAIVCITMRSQNRRCCTHTSAIWHARCDSSKRSVSDARIIGACENVQNARQTQCV